MNDYNSKRHKEANTILWCFLIDSYDNINVCLY